MSPQHMTMQPTRQSPTCRHASATRKGILVRPIATDGERQAAFRLRYEVYVEEMGIVDPEADHARRMIREPWDETALILGAFEGEQLVGTVRVRFGDDSGFGPLEDVLQMSSFDQYFPRRISFTNRFAVRPSHRRGMAAAKVCITWFVHAQRRGISLDFICCQPHLQAMYSKLGYQCLGQDFEHWCGGQMSAMVLNTCDPEHLARCRSPFLRVVDWSRRDPALIALLDRIRSESGVT